MKNYIEKAIKTESKDFDKISNRLQDKSMIRLLHAGMGLATESAEFLDALKKAIYYGKKLDKVNLAEEMGDILWYCAIALDELGVSFEEVMEKNIAKLEARYPEKFTEEKAENRDLEAERKILESSTIKDEKNFFIVDDSKNFHFESGLYTPTLYPKNIRFNKI